MTRDDTTNRPAPGPSNAETASVQIVRASLVVLTQADIDSGVGGHTRKPA